MIMDANPNVTNAPPAVEEPFVQAGEAAAFEQYRRLLFAIAYRMVGTAMEAEDIVQETYLRYRSARPAQIEHLKGYLTTITTRLCLDHLKAAQTQRERYFGIWLPEPVAGDEAVVDLPDTQMLPDAVITQQESISMAFLVILEQLTPVERAVLLLRGVFDYDYPEIAAMVGKSEANCRQIFHRAQAHVRAQRPRFDVTAETHAGLVNHFLQAVQRGDLDGLLKLLAEDVTLQSDGGGKAAAAVHPLQTPEPVARFFLGLAARNRGDYTVQVRTVNGRLGVLIYHARGQLETVFSFETDDNQIRQVHAIRNPDKLARLAQRLAEEGID